MAWMNAFEAIGDLEHREADESINHIWSVAKQSHEQGNRRLKANKPGYTIRGVSRQHSISLFAAAQNIYAGSRADTMVSRRFHL